VTKRVLFFLCIVLAVGGGSSAAAAGSQTLFYEARLKSSSFGNMGTRRMWIKGNLMRWEACTKDFKLILIKNGQGVFLLHPWKKSAGKYPPGSNRENPRSYLPGPTGSSQSFLASVKATQCGREKVGSTMCEVYSYTDQASARKCKLWLSRTNGKPIKLVLKGDLRKKDTITAMYTKFEPGAKVSDSLFELPKGCVVRAMPAPEAAPNKAVRKPSNTSAG
jgi:outer membrane lipoprotein-sorting protein